MSRLGSGIEQIQTVQADTDHLRQNVEAASKRAKQEGEVNNPRLY